jgi:hypothetical protein
MISFYYMIINLICLTFNLYNINILKINDFNNDNIVFINDLALGAYDNILTVGGRHPLNITFSPFIHLEKMQYIQLLRLYYLTLTRKGYNMIIIRETLIEFDKRAGGPGRTGSSGSTGSADGAGVGVGGAGGAGAGTGSSGGERTSASGAGGAGNVEGYFPLINVSNTLTLV